jgi:hypothetical protein
MKAFTNLRKAIILKTKVLPRFYLSTYFPLAFKSPRLCVSALKCFFVLFFFCQINAAQDDLEITAPPPLKIIAKAEKSRLEAETDIKRRTILSIELMETKLLKAESLTAAEDYPAMFAELGCFHALMDDTIDFLGTHDNDSNKVLYNFKRIELTLRKYITRLELIRRELPIRYESYVRKLVKYVREARSKAVEPLFDDTVAPANKPV